MKKGIYDKRLDIMTLQEIFDEVKTHLLTQGRKSDDDTGSCLYRGSGNTKCAAGIFIRNEDYTKNLEGKAWDNNIISEGLVPVKGFLITSLQKIHDNYEVMYWEMKLKDLAIQYNLVYE